MLGCTVEMLSQAERWGTQIVIEDVEHVDLSQRPFVVRGSETEVRAHSIIIATGATAKRLGIPSEEEFWSNGISACAICDGALLIPRLRLFACHPDMLIDAPGLYPKRRPAHTFCFRRMLCTETFVASAAGASPAFKQKELAVVGGGDTALEEALYLTKYGKHVSGSCRLYVPPRPPRRQVSGPVLT